MSDHLCLATSAVSAGLRIERSRAYALVRRGRTEDRPEIPERARALLEAAGG